MFRLTTIFLILLSGCASVASKRPTADTERWKTHFVEVADHVVSFRIPPHESTAFINRAVPTVIDVRQENIFDSANKGPELLLRHWDYQKKRFVHVEGTLRFYIGLEQADLPLTSMDALREAVAENDRLYTIKAFIEEGRPRASDKMTKSQPMTIAETNGLLVNYEISGPIYNVPLGKSHFLVISYSAGGFSDPWWRADAVAAGKAILQSIRITPKS